MRGSIRVLVADDHPVFRYGMRAKLEAEPDTDFVGEATDGEEAVALAAELRPNVILMDLNMPKANDIEATRRILEASPQVGILMLTMFEDDASIFAAIRVGARGYVLKGTDGAETLRAVLRIGRSRVSMSCMEIYSKDLRVRAVSAVGLCPGGRWLRPSPSPSRR